MCLFKTRTVPVPTPVIDPEVEAQKKADKLKKEELQKKQEEYQERVHAGKVGRRSLISGESGGSGFYK